MKNKIKKLSKVVLEAPAKIALKEKVKVCSGCGYTNIGVNILAESIWDYCERCGMRIPYWINTKNIPKRRVVFICPKCKSTNWQVAHKPSTESSSREISLAGKKSRVVGMKECLNCGYVGPFSVTLSEDIIEIKNKIKQIKL